MSGSLLPNAKSQFIDSTGKPLVNGKVYYYIPNTSTPKNTYQDQALTVLNTNPISLDANGQALIWGSGSYRQVVYDQNNNLVWDQVTAAQDWVTALGAGGTTGSGAAQIGWDDQNVAYQLTYRISRVVDSIALLRTLSHNAYTRAFVTGYYAAGDGGGGPYWYDPTDTTSTDNGGTIIVATDGGRWKLQWIGSVSVLQFGVKADNGTTDNSSTLAACAAWVSSGAVRNKLRFPAGKYGYSVSPNWAIQNAEIIFDGEVHFVYSGIGNAILIDGGVSSGGVYNLKFGQGTKPIVDAPSTAQNGMFCRSVLQGSHIGVQVNGCGTAYSGLEVDFAVCAVFDVTVSNNAAGGTFSSKPTNGIKLTNRGAGELTSYCTFINPVLEGVAGSCALLDWAQGNVFIGGTMEGSGSVGLNLTANAIKNKVFGTDFEANANHDIYCLGIGNEFYGINSQLKVTMDGTSHNNRMIGGAYSSLLLTANTFGNLMADFTYNQNVNASTITDNSGSGTIQTNKNPRSNLTNAAQSNIENMPLATTSVSVGTSPFVYTNTSFNTQSAFVSGTNITTINIAHGGTTTVGLQQGTLVELSPGDQLTIAYTAAPPNLNIMTR